MKTPKGEINDKIFELIKDEETLKKMSACKSEQECYDLVKGKIDIGFDEFKSSMAVAKEYMQESESGLLSEEELDQVAGGKSGGDTANLVFGGVSMVAGVVGAAASAAAI
jgi:hypothetical protein